MQFHGHCLLLPFNKVKIIQTGSVFGIINKTINMTVAAQKHISTCITCLSKGINLLPPGGGLKPLRAVNILTRKGAGHTAV